MQKKKHKDDEDEKSKSTYDTVLLTTFVIRKKRCRVYFHRGTLIWETERPPYRRWTLPLTDVLSAGYSNDCSWVPSEVYRSKDDAIDCPPGVVPAVSCMPTSFVLHYAARGAKNKWSHHSVTMSHDDPRQVVSWVKTIRNYLAGLKHRPRKILMFVNPFGGKKKGLEIWQKRVQPLMNVAGVDTKVVVTERAGHIRDYLHGYSTSHDLDTYQAAVCIGGDGTFSELFNGLISRAARDQHIDLNDPDVKLPRPSLPVGVIPSGSTDTLAYTLHGTTDVETAVIHILFGDATGLDLSSVHDERNLLRIYASIFSYGYLGDVVRDSEKFRWMGPQRYDYSGFKKIIANKGYEGEVELLPESVHPASCSKCIKNCTRCDHRTAHSGDEITRGLTVKGKFFMVNGANISCACSKSPMGFSPHCHIGDGCVDVILVRHTSLFNNLRMLLRLTSKDKTLYDLPFVEVYRAREFTFRASPSTTTSSSSTSSLTSSINGSTESYDSSIVSSGSPKSSHSDSAVSVWNCDGEVINASSVRIRVHRQLLKVFSRRMQDNSPKVGSSCFCLL